MLLCAKYGEIEAMKHLIENLGVDPSTQDNTAICHASNFGFLKIVQDLMTNDRVNPAAQNNLSITCASQRGFWDIVFQLLQDDRVSPNYAIEGAISNCNSDALSRLLAATNGIAFSRFIHKWLRMAIETRNKSVITTLSSWSLFKPSDYNVIIEELIANNDLEIVKWLCISSRDVSFIWNLESAVKGGKLLITKFLLEHGSVDPTFDDYKLLSIASFNGYEDIIELLLVDNRTSAKIFSDPRINPNDFIREIWRAAKGRNRHSSYPGNFQIVGEPPANMGILKGHSLRQACRNGDLDVVRQLLRRNDVDPACQNNLPLRLACRYGHECIVKALLQKSQSVDPSSRNNEAIRLASSAGHYRIVRHLLDLGRVSPDALESQSLVLACINGHVDVVDILLGDGRVDMTALVNAPIRYASAAGHKKIVDILLHHDRVRPDSFLNEAIRKASANGHVHVVNRLLEDNRVDPAALDNEAIRMASENGHLRVVSRLLEDNRVNPAALDDVAIRKASMNGHVNVVVRLRKDNRVNPAALNNQAIKMASANGHMHVIAALIGLEGYRVNLMQGRRSK